MCSLRLKSQAFIIADKVGTVVVRLLTLVRRFLTCDPAAYVRPVAHASYLFGAGLDSLYIETNTYGYK